MVIMESDKVSVKHAFVQRFLYKVRDGDENHVPLLEDICCC